MRGLHHLFIVVECRFRVRVCCLGFQLFRVFSSFSSLFYIFSSFLEIFVFLEEFWIIFGGKEGFMTFWRHFKPYGGFLDGFMGFLMEIW